MAREDHDVPADVRRAVLDRDGHCCRVCGRYEPYPALHHVDYRSEGGTNTVDNLVTIGWLPGHDCHLSVVHANKKLWQPLLKIVVQTPGVTAYALRRISTTYAHANVRSRPLLTRPLVGWPATKE